MDWSQNLLRRVSSIHIVVGRARGVVGKVHPQQHVSFLVAVRLENRPFLVFAQKSMPCQLKSFLGIIDDLIWITEQAFVKGKWMVVSDVVYNLQLSVNSAWGVIDEPVQVLGCENWTQMAQSSNIVCSIISRHDISTSLLSLVRAQFISEWEAQGEKMPTFEKAYEITLTRDLRIRHDTYRYVRFDRNSTSVRSITHVSRSFRGKNLELTEIRTFHSALCVCDLGYADNNLCSRPTCGICCAVKSGFKSLAFGKTSMQGRWGSGHLSNDEILIKLAHLWKVWRRNLFL